MKINIKKYVLSIVLITMLLSSITVFALPASYLYIGKNGSDKYYEEYYIDTNVINHYSDGTTEGAYIIIDRRVRYLVLTIVIIDDDTLECIETCRIYYRDGKLINKEYPNNKRSYEQGTLEYEAIKRLVNY